jgi:muramidase (phage lysozyme)
MAVSWAEGADYDSLYGDLLKGRWRTFSDYSRFPYRHGITASGRYQINAGTYHDMSVKLGLTDFSPHTQDLYRDAEDAESAVILYRNTTGSEP